MRLVFGVVEVTGSVNWQLVWADQSPFWQTLQFFGNVIVFASHEHRTGTKHYIFIVERGRILPRKRLELTRCVYTHLEKICNQLGVCIVSLLAYVVRSVLRRIFSPFMKYFIDTSSFELLEDFRFTFFQLRMASMKQSVAYLESPVEYLPGSNARCWPWCPKCPPARCPAPLASPGASSWTWWRSEFENKVSGSSNSHSCEFIISICFTDVGRATQINLIGYDWKKDKGFVWSCVCRPIL